MDAPPQTSSVTSQRPSDARALFRSFLRCAPLRSVGAGELPPAMSSASASSLSLSLSPLCADRAVSPHQLLQRGSIARLGERRQRWIQGLRRGRAALGAYRRGERAEVDRCSSVAWLSSSQSASA